MAAKRLLTYHHLHSQTQSCMIGELGIVRHYQQADSKTLALGCGTLQAQQQPLWISRASDHCSHHPDIHYLQLHLRGNEITAQRCLHGRRTPQEESEHVQMKTPSDGIAKTRQEQVQHGSVLSHHHWQEKAILRPLPKRLIPVISTRGGELSTVTGPSSIGRSMPMEGSIELTDLESKIFDLLKDFLLFYKLETKIRVAGGWVRDKLLRRHSEDIDIALDNMRGKTFCQNLYSYCHMIGLEPNGFAVLKSKPMQARHLEVAKMVIFGVTIDFVNLRPPDYTECSLALQDIGTPEEDAYLRDLTINSLFYNINTGMVEDPTGRGLSDLKAGIIATPSHAKRTFMDDPLRALRALRFGWLLREARGLWRAALLLGTVLEEPSNGQRAAELRMKANFCIVLEKEIIKLGLDETADPFPILEKSRMPEKG